MPAPKWAVFGADGPPTEEQTIREAALCGYEVDWPATFRTRWLTFRPMLRQNSWLRKT